MKLNISGKEIIARPGCSILDMVKELGLYTEKLSSTPLVCKIAGDVFNLNYIPLRVSDVQSEKETVRAAMAASDGKIRLLYYSDAAGKEAYKRTAQFVLFLSLYRLWPDAKVRMNCTVGEGLHISVIHKDFSVEKIKAAVADTVKEDIPLKRKRITTKEAIEYYTKEGHDDKARLLYYRKCPNFDVYEYNGFRDYYYGETAPSTGYLRVWDIIEAEEGFMFIFPDGKKPDRVAKFSQSPGFFNVYREGKQWGQLMECETVADLNGLVDTGRIRELIRVNEALHEKHFSKIADMIKEGGKKAVLLAGPSSSGKTTSANRLATQIRVHGMKPELISLDDYYIDRDKILPDKDGKIDLEHINTIDTELFGRHLKLLLQGKPVEIPYFDFKCGRRAWHGKIISPGEKTVFIIEGLHALNPCLLPSDLSEELIFKLYVSPLIPLNLDDHNRIPCSYLRLLRRIVRDYETRGASVQRTLDMWDSVRQGEEKWIFPYQENADVIFNSSTLYELAVLKKHIFPLLLAIQPQDECYDEVRSLVKVLNFIHEADVDDEIPPTSLVREFIGGNTFYKK